MAYTLSSLLKIKIRLDPGSVQPMMLLEATLTEVSLGIFGAVFHSALKIRNRQDI